MTNLTTVFLLFTLLTPFAANAQSEQHAGFNVYKIETRNSRIGLADEDLISVSPESSTPSTKRQHRYQITSLGQIGDLSALNWKQQRDQGYLILPTTSGIGYDIGSPGQVKVTTASGLVFRFRGGVIDDISDEDGGHPCEATFNKTPGATVGDFKIASCQNRLVFDTGVGTTASAYSNLAGKTKVTDGAGHSCAVTNSLLFSPGRVKEDVKLKSQNQIYKALKALPACASVDLSSIGSHTQSHGTTGTGAHDVQ